MVLRKPKCETTPLFHDIVVKRLVGTSSYILSLLILLSGHGSIGDNGILNDRWD